MKKKIKINQDVLRIYEKLVDENKTVIFLVVDEGIVGILTLVDKIKDNSKKTIEALHSMGVSTYMITGG